MLSLIPEGWIIKIAAVGAAILAVLAVLFKVYEAGKAADQVDMLKTTLKNTNTATKVSDEVRRLTPSAVEQQLQSRGDFRD